MVSGIQKRTSEFGDNLSRLGRTGRDSGGKAAGGWVGRFMIPLFLKSGTHYAQAVEEYFKAGELDIYILKEVNGTIDEFKITTVEDLRNAIDNKQVFEFVKRGAEKPPNAKFRKTIFPRDWTVEDIARAGDYGLNNPSKRFGTQVRGDSTIINYSFVEYKGLKIRLNFDHTGTTLVTWHPVY